MRSGRDDHVVELLAGWDGVAGAQSIVSAHDDCDRTLLHMAAAVGDAGLVRRLLAAGANVTAEDGHSSRTVLMDAATSGDAETVEAVLSAAGGASLADARDMYGRTALHMAALKGSGAAVRLLLAAGAVVPPGRRVRRTVLMCAAKSGDADAVDAVLSAGDAAQLEKRDADACTALIYAAKGGSGAAVRRLLAAGADASVADDVAGTTVLMYAVTSGDASAVDAVLASGRYGAVDATDERGTTALGHAALFQPFDITGAGSRDGPSFRAAAVSLLRHGADPSAPAASLESQPWRSYRLSAGDVQSLFGPRAQRWFRRRRLAQWRVAAVGGRGGSG